MITELYIPYGLNDFIAVIFYPMQPGVVVGIRYMDQTWTKGFGTTDVDTPTVTPDGDTIFRIASITKVFTVSFPYIQYTICAELDSTVYQICRY